MRRILVVIGIAGLTMLAAFRFAGWYADTSALPRYCEDPELTLSLVRKILTEQDPAQDEKRRPYIVAAKILFLVPLEDGEDTAAYLARIHLDISERCGNPF